MKNIIIDQNILATQYLANYCYSRTEKIVIITDDQVKKHIGTTLTNQLQAANISVALFSFPAGEIYKTRETKQQLEDQLFQHQYGRDTCIIALGGGVVLDLAGFLAATYCRGIPVIYIPTTLLAMVDACIGGKTSVNTVYGKNLIGSFTQPELVIMDIDTLASLSKSEFTNGIVELAKHALIANSNLFATLQAHTSESLRNSPDILVNLVRESAKIKLKIVEQDVTEKHIRKLLNFGHTIGHAVELLEDFSISHGQAVAIGMVVEAYISVKKGILSPSALNDIISFFYQYDISLQTKAFNNSQAFLNALILDKKTINHSPHFVLLGDIGKPYTPDQIYTHTIDIDLLHNALKWAYDNCNYSPERL